MASGRGFQDALLNDYLVRQGYDLEVAGLRAAAADLERSFGDVSGSVGLQFAETLCTREDQRRGKASLSIGQRAIIQQVHHGRFVTSREHPATGKGLPAGYGVPVQRDGSGDWP